MTGVILPFKHPATGLAASPPAPSITLAARPGSVTLGALDVEIELSSAQAREFARDLLEFADDADGRA